MPPDQGALGARPPESEIAKMEGAAAAVPQEAPRQARIDAPPRPKKAIRPHYPDGARRRGEQGDVVLEIRVEEDGSVGDVKVVATSGFGELDDAAVRAVRAARFAPARSGDDAVASTARLALSFRIRN